MKILELFAGSRSIGKVAEQYGMEVFSVDWEGYDGINLVKDIGTLQVDDIPFIPDIIWASPDCTTYSVAGIYHHRNGIVPISDYAKVCDNVNTHFISLIRQYQKINPSLVFYIENPRGMMRKMPFVRDMIRRTVWYCQYGDTRAKPTDIFTNSDWVPRKECFNGNKDCHHQSAPRGSRTGTQGIKTKFDKSRIPEQLCQEILSKKHDPIKY